MALLGRGPIRQISALAESALLLSILFFRGLGRACPARTRRSLRLRDVDCNHHRFEPGIVEGDRRRGRAVQEVKRHAVAPDGDAALDDDKRAAGDIGFLTTS